MYYTHRLFDFLRRLSLNNNRPWFNDHKQEYLDLREMWLEDLDRMIHAMAQWHSEFAGFRPTDCAYRIYRDTRFRLDKTPYKTYFSAEVTPHGRKSPYAGYYLHMGLDQHAGTEKYSSLDSGLYAGLWQPEPQTLRKLRHAIVDNIDEWDEIVNSPDTQQYFPGWCSATLKTMPKGWDKNHPQAQYLRMTNYGKFHHCPEEFFFDPAWPEKAAEIFEKIHPLIDFLNYSIDE